MRLHEAMRKVIREFGAAILEEKRFLSVLADYRAFDEFPAVRQILQAVVSDGYGKELCGKSLDGDSSEYLPCADKVKKALSADHHFKKELADYAVDCISFALRMIPSVIEPLDNGFDPAERGNSARSAGAGEKKKSTGERAGTGSAGVSASAGRKEAAPAGDPVREPVPSCGKSDEGQSVGSAGTDAVMAGDGAGKPAVNGAPAAGASGEKKTASAAGASDSKTAPSQKSSGTAQSGSGAERSGAAQPVKKGSGIKWAAAFIGVAAVIALAVGLSVGDKAPAGNSAGSYPEAAAPAEDAAPLQAAAPHEKSADKSEVVPEGNDAVAYAVGLSLGSYLAETNREQGEFGMELDSSLIIEGFSDGMYVRDRLQGVDKQKLLADFDARLKEKADDAEKKKAAEKIRKGEEFLAENAKKEGVKTTESGLQYQVIEPAKDADAPRPDKNSVVTVFYKGTLLDGKVFDQNIGKDPIEFPLNAVIPGWSEGVSLMQKGAKYRFWIPPKLGYGDRAVGQIPANSVLVFEVELVDVKSGEEVKAEAEKAAAEKAKADEAEAAAPGGSR